MYGTFSERKLGRGFSKRNLCRMPEFYVAPSILQTSAKLRDAEQQGGKAKYGVRLLKHRSEDLQRKLGSGFSKKNLYRMQESCLAYSILPAPEKLNWPIIQFRGEQKSVFISVNLVRQDKPDFSINLKEGLRGLILAIMCL